MNAGFRPDPPSTVRAFVDTELAEAEALQTCAFELAADGALADAVALLAVSQRKLVHLGKLADVQALTHGLPDPSDDRPPLALSTFDEALLSFTMMLTAAHLDPEWTYEQHALVALCSRDDSVHVDAEEDSGSFHPEPAPHPATPHVNYGRWSPAESAECIRLARLYGHGSAPRIAAALRTRTAAQVRAHLKAQSVADSELGRSASIAETAGMADDGARLEGDPQVGDGSAVSALPATAAAASAAAPIGAAPVAAAPVAAAAPAGAARAAKWSAAEVELLEEAARLYGPADFARIAAHVGSRTVSQVKGRYYGGLRREASLRAKEAGQAAASARLVADAGAAAPADAGAGMEYGR